MRYSDVTGFQKLVAAQSIPINISLPKLYPDSLIAFEIYDKTDSVDLIVAGAKPPSSPTLVADFPRLSDNIDQS